VTKTGTIQRGKRGEKHAPFQVLEWDQNTMAKILGSV
jgi:hypothetical protein